MANVCVFCSGKYVWRQSQAITSHIEERKIVVDIFQCSGCARLFLVDKESKNPNRIKTVGSGKNKFDEEQKKRYTPKVDKNSYDEEVFFGAMYINSKGKLGVKPDGYVSTKPFELGGKIYPAIRKARVFSRGKKQ